MMLVSWQACRNDELIVGRWFITVVILIWSEKVAIFGSLGVREDDFAPIVDSDWIDIVLGERYRGRGAFGTWNICELANADDEMSLKILGTSKSHGIALWVLTGQERVRETAFASKASSEESWGTCWMLVTSQVIWSARKVESLSFFVSFQSSKFSIMFLLNRSMRLDLLEIFIFPYSVVDCISGSWAPLAWTVISRVPHDGSRLRSYVPGRIRAVSSTFNALDEKPIGGMKSSILVIGRSSESLSGSLRSRYPPSGDDFTAALPLTVRPSAYTNS